ncbi:CLUMA_CG021087, isoform A [Clunio marinus]|uniref:CLUMA_CG021087, isoform A n=1 Tax=Clunio marinus TaxID=568069 RepID=A0A1J1J7K7_9DIPT|nr:CLUMA_CG021087, isoform A [Clunio marinus]
MSLCTRFQRHPSHSFFLMSEKRRKFHIYSHLPFAEHEKNEKFSSYTKEKKIGLDGKAMDGKSIMDQEQERPLLAFFCLRLVFRLW